MKRPVYELNIDEFDEKSGMFLISMVDRPAMQIAAVKLSEQEAPMVRMKATDTDKQYLMSAVIVPNKLIYRNDERGEYDILFKVSDVEKIRNKFFRVGNLNQSNFNHLADESVNAQLIESWIIEDTHMDKSRLHGFDLPVGTLMATYHILDDDFWKEKVLTGEVNGFSLEGRFYETAMKLAEAAGAETDIFAATLDELMTLMEGTADV